MYSIGTQVKVITDRFGSEQKGLTGVVETIRPAYAFGYDCGVRIDDNQGPYYSRHYLYYNWYDLAPLILKYDPNQQGDTDEDI